MAKYNYGDLNNKQIKEVMDIQKEISSYGNNKGAVTSDSKPKNIEGLINREHVNSAIGVAKTIFNLFV